MCLCILFCHKENENLTDESETWTDMIDRGGLIHISDQLFSFFMAMELELRLHLQICKGMGTKEAAVKKIIENDEVKFHWSEVAVNWEEEESRVLLEMIAVHWVTVRGFSHASAFLEKYKQKYKTTVQKSKGLRKKLSSAKSVPEATHEL